MRSADRYSLSREEVHDAVLEGVDAKLVDVLQPGERYIREEGIWSLVEPFCTHTCCGAIAVQVGSAVAAALDKIVAHWDRPRCEARSARGVLCEGPLTARDLEDDGPVPAWARLRCAACGTRSEATDAMVARAAAADRLLDREIERRDAAARRAS